MRLFLVMLPLVACACARSGHDGPVRGDFVLRGGLLPGGERVEIAISDGRIIALGDATATSVVDISGRYVVPAFIDSHVHLEYWSVHEQQQRGGVAVSVDLGAPLSAVQLSSDVLHAGPMLTAPSGYPTQSWGADGYGWECDDSEDITGAVRSLAAAGASVIKVAAGSGGLATNELRVAVFEAHRRNLRVVAHALSREAVDSAADAGVDALAHVPLEPISRELAARWRGRAVISTMSAFGGTAVQRENLRRLASSGATILYGTDLGNSRRPGIVVDELEELSSAGMTKEAVLAAATSAPARFWNLPFVGAIAPGMQANLLVLPEDPLIDWRAFERPSLVILRGTPI